MCPGVINYTDVDGGGYELLKKATIDEALATLQGDPLTIGHVKTNLTAAELLDVENGKIDEVGYNPDTGWYFCKGTVETDQARKALKDGWGISVGTRVLEFGPGGTWLQVPYDREIVKLKFHHLALVEPGKQPRFEEATARLNSKQSKPMFQLFRKKAPATAGAQPTEEATPLDPKSKLNLGDGKTATVEELIAAERDNHCHAVMADDYIEHEGVRYHCGTLVSNFKEKMNAGHHTEARQNATTETPEQKAAREVHEAAELVTKTKTALDTATAAAERANATDAEKSAVAPAKTAYEAAVIAAGQAADRFNDLRKAKTVTPPAAAKTEIEKALDEANGKLAQAKLDLENERANAKKEQGLKSFAILGRASEQATAAPFLPPSGGMKSRLALGKKICGSDAKSGGRN